MTFPIINIKSYPQFEADQSSTEKNKYFYSYKICISNVEGGSCQLMSRRWLITDANGQKQEVVGDGVIGQQPVINEGEEFSYTSGCLLETPVGTMEGYYIMRTGDGEEFKVPISPFLLAVPSAIN